MWRKGHQAERKRAERKEERVECNETLARERLRRPRTYRGFYNYERLHMCLGYRTPAAVYLDNDGQKTDVSVEKTIPKIWHGTCNDDLATVKTMLSPAVRLKAERG